MRPCLARWLLVLCVSIVYPTLVHAQADDLPRHAVIGLQVAPADLSKPEDPAANPATVKKVFSGGAGEAAGFAEGDILRAIDGVPVITAIGFAHTIRTSHSR